MKGTRRVARERKKEPKKKLAPARSPKIQRLTQADLDHFRELLLRKRREISRNVSEIEGETLKKSRLDASGDLSSMPIHMADLGTDNYEQEFALGLMDSERRILHEIDAALQRIHEGTYGVCEGTGELISRARLEAQPWARYCVEYARKLEEGQSFAPEPIPTEEDRD